MSVNPVNSGLQTFFEFFPAGIDLTVNLCYNYIRYIMFWFMSKEKLHDQAVAGSSLL